MRSKFLIPLALVFAAGPALAGDLWLVSEGVNGMSVSSDVSTLNCERGLCSIWEVTQYAELRSDGALSLRDLADYDCSGLRTRTELETKLGARGQVLATVKATDGAWVPVQPNTVGAATLTFACGFQAADPRSVQLGALDIAGRHFSRMTRAVVASDAPAGPQAWSKPASGIALQVAASPTAAGAQAAIAALKLQYQAELAGLDTRIEPAMVGGKRVYRSMIAGFATYSDAQTLCGVHKASGGACFVRASPSSNR